MAEVLLIRKFRERRKNLKIPRRLLISDVTNPFNERLLKFVDKYKLSKDAALYLIEELKSHLDDNAPSGLSIDMQICDADLKILDLVARWPGSWHDSLIWNLSGARKMFTDGIVQSDVFLLGDSAYPLEPWLMTPFAEPTDPAEEIFNKKHRSARNIIERCFGVMKGRFRIISRSAGILCYDPEKAAKIIIAVAVLHNICLKFNIDLPENPDMDSDDEDDNNHLHHKSQISALAIQKRQDLANAFQTAR